MSALSIPTASPFDAIRHAREDGTEFWSARELMPILGYGADWRNFADAVDRAKAACANSDHDPADHFGDATKMVRIGSGAHRGVADYHLTRYGAYLVAMNGDPRKPEIAAAQTYFAVRTREAETAPPARAIAAIGRRELALMVIEAEDRATAAEQRLAIASPKANAWDTFVNLDGDHSVEEVAKMLAAGGIKTGRTRLFDQLNTWGWIYRYGENGPYRPIQRYVERGWLRLKAQVRRTRDGDEFPAPPQVRITAEGAKAIHAKLTAPVQLELEVTGR